MAGFARLRICLVAFAAGLLCSCGLPNSYNVRVTVDIESPAGPRRGTGVFQITASRALALLPEENEAHVSLHGDAIPIDFPNGRTLFVLLAPVADRGSLEGSITAALDPDFRGGAEGFLESTDRLSAPGALNRSAELAPSNYPLLASFADAGVPSSIQAIRPDDLTLFEPGARVRNISVTVTDEPVNRHIDRRLPWVRTLRHYLDGSSASFSNRLANRLDATAFRRGD